MTIMMAMATVTFSVRNVTGNNRSHFHSNTKSTFVDVLSLVFQPCAIFHEGRNHHRSRGYILNHHLSLRKSCIALSTSLWSLLLFLPPFQQLIHALRSP